ncbi:MAG TPA: hypothetical protein VNO30_48535 [Kofleriaceae bacterium]|nr:hypothetical protein [Kofleriaceae bacterium]
MTQWFPTNIRLIAGHALTASLPELVLSYTELVQAAGGGEVVRFAASELGIEPGETKRGSLAAFRAALPKAGKKPHYARFVTNKELELAIHRGDETYEVSLRYPPETKPRAAWVQTMVQVARRTLELPAFAHAAVKRTPGGFTTFVPEPPIARTNHFVITTEAEAADAYDDPKAFWCTWQTVDKQGEHRLCTRGLADLDEHSWLALTFESTMAMARSAKADLTTYYAKPYWGEEFALWWEFGDYQAEKAGYPALAEVGYDPDTRAFELFGFITKTPLIQGGPEPRHVLVREIYGLRTLARRKQDREGRPMDAVNVIWPERWMAMSERRPLLDVGAHVFYLDDNKQRVPVT